MSTAISMTDRARILAPTVENSHSTQVRKIPDKLTDHLGKTLHQPVADDHPLMGVADGYLILAQERLEVYIKSAALRWVIRKLFDWADIAGDTRRHDLGIVLYEDLAIQIVAQKNLEAKSLKHGDKWYGFVFSWHEVPVNRLMGAESVRYGNLEYSGTDIDSLHRARNPTLLVPLESVDTYQNSKLDETFRLLDEKVKQVAASVKPAPVV